MTYLCADGVDRLSIVQDSLQRISGDLDSLHLPFKSLEVQLSKLHLL